MQNLRFRCPCCHRLYEADSQDIKIHNPQFECISCHTRFGFFFPPQDPANVSCFVVPNTVSSSRPQANVESDGIDSFRETLKKQLGASLRKTDEHCPKCAATKFESATECYSCGVIFAKLEGLPADPNLKAQPSLVRKWKEVLSDYDNQSKHDYFVKSCLELEALPFAVFKYEEIKKLQGTDAKADEMLQKLTAMGFVKLQQNSDMLEKAGFENLTADLAAKSGKMANVATSAALDMDSDLEMVNEAQEQDAELILQKILAVAPESLHGVILRAFVFREKLKPLVPYLPYTPYMVSAILILWGLFSIGHRNTVGLGVAIFILVFGWRNWLGGKNYSS